MRYLYVGVVLLVLSDWLYDLGLVDFPFSKSLRALLFAMLSIYLLRTGFQFRKFNFPFGHLLTFYAALNIIYSALSLNILDNLYYSIRIIFWLIATVVAYRLSLSGIFSKKKLQQMIISTILISAGFTIYFMTLPETEAGQNAGAYLLLWCLPLLFMTEKSRLKNFGFALAIFAILLTVKRGAMIALVLSLFAYGLTYIIIHGNIRKLIKLLKVLIILTIISSYALATNWDAIQTRFQDTSGSGRDRMYSMLISHWIHSEPSNIIFGFGIQSVQRYTGYIYYGEIMNKSGKYAHSDWIQLMHDFGLLGISFLIWLHIKMLILVLKSYKIRHPFTPSLVMGYVILFLVNIYSGHLMAPGAFYFGLLIAYSSAILRKTHEPTKSRPKYVGAT
ncbi:O-Antigen ligase [Desulfocapsa sulfexigens DSM 10523]|uniref:O-Antigen ligase n=2 Tax=Desulfocapsa TaxID=53318 RepID=M1PPM4_DESSD|nr:O-Antigen ligase [Desulfocapsa sulfexigens DSM 10523]